MHESCSIALVAALSISGCTPSPRPDCECPEPVPTTPMMATSPPTSAPASPGALSPSSQPAPPASTTDRPPDIASDASAIAQFNAWAASSGASKELLSLLARAFAKPEEPTDTAIDVKYTPRESPTKAAVTVTEDGYLDDSVRGRRYELSFERDAGTWVLTAVVTSIRCWPGRGHQDFSPERCN
jgi:hypothetical protein